MVKKGQPFLLRRDALSALIDSCKELYDLAVDEV